MEVTLQQVVTVVLSAMFIIGGSLKYPILQKSHESLKKTFEVYVSVFPGLFFGSPVNPVTYMYVVGTIECLCGLGLLLGSPRVKVICSGGLISIMVIGVSTIDDQAWTLQRLYLSFCFTILSHLVVLFLF